MMGHIEGGYAYFVVASEGGNLTTLVATEDQIEELARDLLDLVGRGYCLPYVCDHLDVQERRS